jgi:hypothetical protein
MNEGGRQQREVAYGIAKRNDAGGKKDRRLGDMDNYAKVHNIAYNNMEKADNELEHEKEEDKEYDDEDLGEEELPTLFNATYAESKVKSSYFSIKYMFDYIYHGSRISRFDMSLYELVN